VSTTRASAIDESLLLAQQLAVEGMSLDAFIVNRVQRAAGPPTPAQLADALRTHLTAWPAERAPGLVEKIARLASVQNTAAALEADRVESIAARLESLMKGGVPLQLLPELPANVHGVDALKRIALVMGAAPVAL
jgi:hypothetical protein